MPAKGSGVTSINRLRQRCYVANRLDPDCCWLWKGATRANGQAAVWISGSVVGAPHAALLLSGRTVPPGGRAWATCGNPTCGNPRHAAGGTYAEWGAWIRESAQWVGNQKNVAAAKARARRRSKINLQIARDIRRSPLPPLAEARRVLQVHGIEVSRTLVDNVRQMKRWAEPDPFAGLGARNA